MREKIVAVILAGGAGRRMGSGAKPLRLLAGRPLVFRVAEAIGQQVDATVLNINDPADGYRGLGLPQVADSLAGRLGPLAGILAGMDWTRDNHPDAKWLLSVPADAPFLPGDLVARFGREARRSGAAHAHSGARDHPVVGLWPLARRDDLADLLARGQRRADSWTSLLAAGRVRWADANPDPFFNVNTPEDLTKAELLCSLRG